LLRRPDGAGDRRRARPVAADRAARMAEGAGLAARGIERSARLTVHGPDPDADALLDDLLALPPPERGPRLASRAGVTPEVRAYVEHLLAEADKGDPFLDPAAIRQGPLV